MKISDKIRNDFLWNDDVGEVAYRQLLCIANRIDREMVELPKDADGKPIRVGDVLYSSGNEFRVVNITVKANEVCVAVYADDGTFCPWVNPKYLSRKNPEPLEPEPADSLERIADELEAAEGWCDQNGLYATDIVSISVQKLSEWSDRIRKLAKKEGE